MIDEIHDRTYQAGRAELHDGIDRLVSKVAASFGATFRAIERIQFDAPWKPRSATER